jgi:hypothetical protein
MSTNMDRATKERMSPEIVAQIELIFLMISYVESIFDVLIAIASVVCAGGLLEEQQGS